MRQHFDRRNVKPAVLEICAILNSYPYSAELQVAVPPAEIVLGLNWKFRATEMIADGRRDFLPAYTAWLRKPVVLLLVIRQCHVPVPCRIVGESATALRVRFTPGWEMDLRKELILAIEEDSVPVTTRPN